MTWSVGVAGASGYAGAALLALIEHHPDLQLTVAAAGGQAGEPITSVHPQLAGLAGQAFADTDPQTLSQCDLVFLALPHGTSAALADQLSDDTLVVDLGADHRLQSEAAWTTYYGGDYAEPWTYAIPELPNRREVIASSSRVACGGCYATAIELSLAPLLAAGLVESTDIVVVAASGTSGAGRKASIPLIGSEVMGSMSPYKVGGLHQHTAEVEQELSIAAGSPATISFTPTLAPMPRGILSTSTAKLAAEADPQAIEEALVKAYSDSEFVQVLPTGQWPTTAAVAGSNRVDLQVAVDQHAGRVVVSAAIDNLVKGAAGQAVQCANLMLGLPETTGLSVNGVAP